MRRSIPLSRIQFRSYWTVFDFTAEMGKLLRHIASTCDEFRHVRMDHVAVSYIQTRSPGVHGVYASLQPLRFKDGESTIKHRGRTYAMPRIVDNGHEILYVIYFAMPRFMNLSFEEKMTTVFHELYHISPEFNGDIRRLPGRNYAHGYSRKRYNERVRVFVDQYLATPESEEQTEFLRMSFDELTAEYGKVRGTRIHPPKPKLAGGG